MTWCVYLLEGKTSKQKIKRFYIGSTNDLHRRLGEHILQRSSFGKLCNGNIRIAWWKKVNSMKEARSLERKMKKLTRKQREELKKQFYEERFFSENMFTKFS